MDSLEFEVGEIVNLRELFGERVLVIAAHPDDEAIGAGGTLARIAECGVETFTIFLSDGESSRLFGKAQGEVEAAVRRRRSQAHAAMALLGGKKQMFLDFPDNQLDGVPLLDLVRKVEPTVETLQPNLIITHSASDLNVDHRICLQVALVAGRPGKSSVTGVLSFEIPSSTDLTFGSANSFSPNLSIDISSHLPRKLEALGKYELEIPSTNHPRSLEAIERLARYRGDQNGVEAAEVFEVQRLSL